MQTSRSRIIKKVALILVILAGLVIFATTPAPVRNTGDFLLLSNIEGNLELYHGTMDGRQPTRLTDNKLDDMHPSWSPAGDLIVYTSRVDLTNADLFVIGLKGGTNVRLTNDPALDYSPSWSPDGRRIAFISNRDGHSNLFTVNADGTGLRQLTHHQVTIQTPQWSPDGSEILFILGNNLAVISADGSTWRKLTNERDVHDSQPEWSPDGTRVAFTRRLNEVFNIFVVDAEGTKAPRQLTNDPWYDTDPRWSPDSSQLIWLSARADGVRKELYVMNADGNGIRRLTDGGAEVMTPAWSPDGNKVSFVRYVGNRFVAQTVTPEGGEINTISPFNRGLELVPLFRPG